MKGEYQLEPASWWTAGFWPGLLWLLYRDTQDEQLKLLAESCEGQLDQVIADYYRLDHDIGFMWTLTSVARYKLLGAEDSSAAAYSRRTCSLHASTCRAIIFAPGTHGVKGKTMPLGHHRLHDEPAAVALGLPDDRRPAVLAYRRAACRYGARALHSPGWFCEPYRDLRSTHG